MNFTVKEDYLNTFGAVVMDGDIPVALCRPVIFYKNGSDSRAVTKEQALRNARLFSAAPELLSALIAIWPEAKANDVGGPDIAPLHEAVRAAINKATGNEIYPVDLARTQQAMTPNDQLLTAVGKFIKAKGRFHTEQNYAALVAAYDAVLADSSSK